MQREDTTDQKHRDPERERVERHRGGLDRLRRTAARPAVSRSPEDVDRVVAHALAFGRPGRSVIASPARASSSAIRESARFPILWVDDDSPLGALPCESLTNWRSTIDHRLDVVNAAIPGPEPRRRRSGGRSAPSPSPMPVRPAARRRSARRSAPARRSARLARSSRSRSPLPRPRSQAAHLDRGERWRCRA